MMGYGSVSEGMSSTGVEAMYSRGCEGGIDVEVWSDLLMRYTTVLVTAEKYGGDSAHSTGNRLGMMMSGFSPGRFVNGVAILRSPNGVRWN